MSEKHQQKARKIVTHLQGRGSGNEPRWQPLVQYFAAALEAVERETAQRCAEIAGPSPCCEGMGGCCHDGCQERRKIAMEIRTEFEIAARAGKGQDADQAQH